MKKFVFLGLLLASYSALSAKVVQHPGGSLAAYDNDKAVVKFYGSWCTSCTAIKQKFIDLSNDPKYSKITFVEVDCGKYTALVNQNKISAIPAFLFLDHGKRTDTLTGNKPAVLIQKLDKLIQ